MLATGQDFLYGSGGGFETGSPDTHLHDTFSLRSPAARVVVGVLEALCTRRQGRLEGLRGAGGAGRRVARAPGRCRAPGGCVAGCRRGGPGPAAGLAQEQLLLLLLVLFLFLILIVA